MARGGDGEAFRALVTPYNRLLRSVCARIVGTEADVDDAVQLALSAAWQHLDKFEGRSAFSTWLYRIAHNASLSLVRKRVPDPMGDNMPEVVSRDAAPDSQVSDRDAVRWALERIPPDFRAALVLYEYGNLTYLEIAEVQGIKVETVKTRIARARQALAHLLADRV